MKNKRFILPAFVLLLFVMFILPFFSTTNYSIISHTTSHLGAQGAPYAWVMNLVFLIIGLACIIEAQLYLKTFWVQKLLLTIFGIGFLMTAYFQHAPIDTSIFYDVFEDKMHSISASIIGFSFTLFAFSAAFIETNTRRRVIALVVGFFSTGLSILMFSLNSFSGLWQRLIFIISFIWIIYFLNKK